MFCSNCGAEASGNFCSRCGAPLSQGPGPAEPAAEEASGDWSREVVYERLIRIPEVRERISRHAAMASKRMSGQEFLALCEKVVPMGVPLEAIGSLAQPAYARLGIKTGKERSETLPIPPGTAIVGALCSLARRGQELRQVRQLDDGCLLEATLPSDMWSFAGDLLVEVHASGTGARVDAATKIGGQMFDWGKSNRCLNTLFEDVRAMAAE